jgi:sugar phosphate isomerase/epimerase
MEIGIFERVFLRHSLAAALDAVQSHGLRAVQFDLSSAGLPTMPDEIEPRQAETIRAELSARHVTMAAVSGTFNIIHPDEAARQHGMRRLRILAAASPALGTDIITLSTGTRDAGNMWRHHPGNDTGDAWREALTSMAEIAAIGEEYGVTMAFEPEVNNVVDSARKARRMLDEVRSPRIKIVMDGANIFHTGELPRMAEILDGAFDLLGPDIALAHAKDLDHDGDAGSLPAGHGVLDYDRYLRLLQQSGFTGALILHGLNEQQVPGCVAFLRAKLSALGL